MPPPRNRQRPRFQLSNYDRELLQAVHDRRLDRDDPEVQAVLQRVEQAPAGEPWQTASVSMQPEAPPPPSQFESDLAMTRAGQAGREGVVSLLPRSYSLFDEPAAENRPSPRPDHYTVPDLGRDVLNVATSVATQPIGDNPYSPDVQDALREQGLPTDPRISPWGGIEAATGALPATAGALFDLATGETDPDIPDLINNPPTWRSTLEARDAPEWAQNVGTVADLLVGPEDLVFPGASAVTGVLGAALGTGRALRRTVKAATGAPIVQRAARTNADILQRMVPSLDTKQYRALEKALDSDPGLSTLLQDVLPEEIPSLLRSPAGMAKFTNAMNNLPGDEMLSAAAALGDVKLGWYTRSKGAINTLFGEDADLFAGVLASMSPQTSVESNLTNALNFFVNWRKAGRPRQADTVKKLIGESVQGGSDKSALDAWVDNTVRVITDNSRTISGPKVDSFWTNLRNRPKETPFGNIDQERTVVLDAWMSHLLGVPGAKWFAGYSPGGSGPNAAAKRADAAIKKAAMLERGDPGLQPTYVASSARIRGVGRALDLTPSETQEAMWSTAYALYNKAKSMRIQPSEVLRRNLLTPEDILGTPDFATLLDSGRYADIVGRDADLASRLPNLADIPESGGRAITRGPGHAAGVAEIGRVFDLLRDERRVNSSVVTGTSPEGFNRATQVLEATGDPGNTTIFPASEGLSPVAQKGVLETTRTLAERDLASELARGAETGMGQGGATVPVTGDWSATTGPAQHNVGMSSSFLLPEGDEAAEATLRATHDVNSAILGQTAAAHAVFKMDAPSELWNAVVMNATGATSLSKQQVAALGASVGKDWVVMQRLKGVDFLHIDSRTGDALPISQRDINRLERLTRKHAVNSKGGVVPWTGSGAQNVAKKGYRNLAGPSSSRYRTGASVGAGSDWAAMTQAQQSASDPAFQSLASKVLDVKARSGGELRPDEENLLNIIAGLHPEFPGGGATALSRALQDPSQVLPVLAALGLWQASGSGPESPDRQPST